MDSESTVIATSREQMRLGIWTPADVDQLVGAFHDSPQVRDRRLLLAAVRHCEAPAWQNLLADTVTRTTYDSAVRTESLLHLARISGRSSEARAHLREIASRTDMPAYSLLAQQYLQ